MGATGVRPEDLRQSLQFDRLADTFARVLIGKTQARSGTDQKDPIRLVRMVNQTVS